MGMLDGKVAVITGAAAGIGRGFAEVFAEQGADIAICDVQPKIEGVATAVEAKTGRRVRWWLADVSRPEEVVRFVDGAAYQFGGIDYLVNNAGVWLSTHPVEDSWLKALADWDYVHSTNLKGVFLVGRRAIPHLVARGPGGHIINIATDHIFPPPGAATGGGTRMDVYDSSKWGVNGLTQSWSKNLKPHGIRVNALCMDATDSEMIRFAAGAAATEEVTKHWMHPHQIAQLGLDLIAEGVDGRTGENIGAWMGHEVKLPPRAEVLPSRHR